MTLMPVFVASAGYCTPYWRSYEDIDRAIPAGNAQGKGDPAFPEDPLVEGAPSWMKRRLTRLSRMMMNALVECIGNAGHIAGNRPPLVVATSNGEINVVGRIMHDLLGSRNRVSPQDFQNSVYNAPAGYFSIAARWRAPSNTVARGNLTFEYGLIDALCRLGADEPNALLAAGDEAIATQWADPGHSKVDVCGSLWLTRSNPTECVAKIVALVHAKPSRLEELEEIERGLAADHDAILLNDHRLVGGPGVLPRVLNPSAGVLHFLSTAKTLESGQRAVISRSDSDHDMVAVVIEGPGSPSGGE